jgi:DNA-damage-inducible protein D
MNRERIGQLQKAFDAIARVVLDSEYEIWHARDLMPALGYDRWENFSRVIQKAVAACNNAGGQVANHFRDVTKMVRIGSGVERPIEDVMLTRYACYLVAQNGDPRKEEIAFAQTYFAVQTRKLEIIEERIRLQERLSARQKLTESETELSRNIYERGVDDQGFGRIRSKGDAALFGGHGTQQMKKKLGVPENRPLADFLPTVTIAAKNLATEITNHNVREKDLQGEPLITGEHVQNNTSVRAMLVERGIKPEALPPEEDLKKLQRRVKTAERKMISEGALYQKAEEGE